MFLQALLSRCRPAKPLRISPHRFASFLFPRPQARHQPRLLLWGTAISLATYLTFSPRTVHLDADSQSFPEPSSEDSAATSISFPKTMRVSSKINLPPLSLVGLGVRTVSFLNIKVYSIGFYADLDNPNLMVPKDLSPEEKIKYIVRNTACVIRIVPTRSTSYTHLRDAFMRALQARLVKGKQEGTLTEDDAQSAASPMRKLKSLFPNSPLTKHTPLDVFLSPPTLGRPRALVFRDLGAIEHDWVATELVLNYFEGAVPSPALKKSVIEKLETFGTK